MGNYLMCEGTLSPARAGPTTVPNVLACDSGWVVKTDTQLLSEALATRLMSREDFFELSGYVVAIFVAAISIRLLLRSLTQEVSTYEN